MNIMEDNIIDLQRKVKVLNDENNKMYKEIKELKEELEVAKTNEETYRLEMLDITKRLGLDEETLFDDVKDKAERLNNIINELNCGIKELDNMFYETFRISQNGYYSISEWELKDFTNKLQELKGSDK